MNAAEINEVKKFCLSGDLNFTTVPEINRRGCYFISQNSNPVFDLGETTSTDNAGVALLISLTRCAKSKNKEILFIKLPMQLLALLEASGLIGILPIG